MMMIKAARNSIIIVIATILILSACTTYSTINSIPYVQGLSSTYAVQTMVANPDLILLVQTATPTTMSNNPTISLESSPLQAEPIQTEIPEISLLSPTFTPVPSLTPIEINSISSITDLTSGDCINAAEFVQDITIPDDTLIKPSKKFTKIWKLRNTGSCTWTPDYALVFVAGDRMKGDSPKRLNTTVEPGQSIELAIDLVAPAEMSYYQGNWMLQDEFGENFGTGSDANGPFWVSIKVYVAGWKNIFSGGGGYRTKGGAGCGGGG